MTIQKEKTMDWGGITLIVDEIKVGATAPGQDGDSIEELVEGGSLDVVPGTAEAEKALILDENSAITAGIAALTVTDLTVEDDLIVTDDLTVTGLATVGETLAVTGATTLSAAVMGGVQTLTGAGAVNTTTLVTRHSNSGTAALTLANGTNGQIKTIVCTAASGESTLTPTTCTGFTTIVFDAAGESVQLVFLTTVGWMITAVNGATPA
jgi:hypothetical protein